VVKQATSGRRWLARWGVEAAHRRLWRRGRPRRGHGRRWCSSRHGRPGLGTGQLHAPTI